MGFKVCYTRSRILQNEEENMDCKKAQSLVTAYIKRQLDDRETEEFIEHISRCKECHEELEIYFTIHFALQKLDEEQNVSYNIKKMLEDDLEATERKVRIRRVFCICTYGIMLLAEIVLALTLLTQVEFWVTGNVEDTAVYRMLYRQEAPVIPGREKRHADTQPASLPEDETEALQQTEMMTDGENDERKNSTD